MMTTMMTMTTTTLAFLATYLVHSTILLGTAWVLGRFMVRAEAWRDTLWKAALVGGVATTLVAQLVPLGPVRLMWSTGVNGAPTMVGPEAVGGPDARPAQSLATAGFSSAQSGTPASTSPDPDAERSSARQASSSQRSTEPVVGIPTGVDTSPSAPSLARSGLIGAPRSLSVWLVSAWIVVALALLLRFGMRRLRLAAILRDQRRVTDPALTGRLAELRRSAGLWAPVKLSTSPAVSSPLLTGRREICVPERFFMELGPDEQRAALAHELGHLARRDPVWQLVALLMECTFFFQPLHRVARRSLRESAEYLADAWAVRLSGERLGLARCLSEVAAWVAPDEETSPAHTVAMAEGGSPLLERVSRLLEREPEAEPRAAVRIAAGLALIVMTAFAAPGVGAAPDRSEAGVSEAAAAGAGPVARSSSERGPDFEEPSLPEVEPDSEVGDDGLVEQVQAAPSVVHVPPEGDLDGRIAAARVRADAAATSRYWLAWAVPSVLPSTTHVSMDSEDGINIHVTDERYPMLRSMGGGAPAAAALGVQGELVGGDDGYDVIVLARIDAGSEGPRLTRLAVRSPAMPLRLTGDVYWLGRLDAGQGFAWQVREHRRTTDRRVGELIVEAAALHDASGVEEFLRTTASEPGAGRDVREAAIEGLVHHPSDESFAFLMQVAQGDPDLDMRTEAVETLGELDHPGAPGAVRELARGGDPRVREEAIESLGERQDPGVMATLIEVASGDPDPDIRVAAVEAIGDQPHDRAVPALRSLMEGEADREVLMEVAEQLGEVGTPEALSALDALVAADPGNDVVEEAVEVIAEAFASELAVPRLEAISRDHPSEGIRREALEQLLELRLGGPGGGEMLLDIALNHADEEWRADAVDRMTDLPAVDAVRLLSRVFAESDDMEVQAEVAESLGEVGTPEALAALEEIVSGDAAEEVMVEAVESVGEEFGREQAIPVLQRIVTEHPSARVRREALEQLADLGAAATGGPPLGP